MKYSRSVVVVAMVWLVVGTASTPVRRSPNLEARRRSAIDRSLVRFGRSYPQEPTAVDIREAFQRSARRGNAFLRFGRTQPIALTADDLVNLIRSYDEDYESKRSPSFIRYGRDPSFVRFGRTTEDKGIEEGTELVVNGYPQRKSRARDHFIRLGRDSEELDDVDENERRKRSTEPCHDCQ